MALDATKVHEINRKCGGSKMRDKDFIYMAMETAFGSIGNRTLSGRTDVDPVSKKKVVKDRLDQNTIMYIKRQFEERCEAYGINEEARAARSGMWSEHIRKFMDKERHNTAYRRKNQRVSEENSKELSESMESLESSKSSVEESEQNDSHHGNSSDSDE